MADDVRLQVRTNEPERPWKDVGHDAVDQKLPVEVKSSALPSGAATSVLQQKIIDILQEDGIPMTNEMRNLLQAIALPDYVNRGTTESPSVRNTIVGGTLPTVSTVGTLNNIGSIGGLQAQELIYNQVYSAWALLVRSNI